MTTNFLYSFVRHHGISKALFTGYFVIIFAIFYFLFLTFFGEKGLRELFIVKQKIENKEILKQELLGKIRAKKNMVDGMGLDSLDVDLLDEQSRKVLGYVSKNEVVIYQDQTKKEEAVQ